MGGITRRQMLVSLGAAAAGSAGLALLAGCNKGSAPAAGGSGAKPFAGKTLSLLCPNLSSAVALQGIKSQWEQLTGATIRWDMYAEPEALKKATLELGSQSAAYDVILITTSIMAGFVTPGWIDPLDGYIQGKDNPFQLDGLFKSQVGCGNYKGKQYALPVHASTCSFFYRKDVLDQHGIKQPPQTFAELMDVAREIHSKEMPAFICRGQRGSTVNMWIFPQIAYGLGAQFFKKYPEDLTPTLDSDAMVAAAQYFVDLCRKYGAPNIPSANFNEVVLALQQGKAAMSIEGTAQGTTLLNPAKSPNAEKTGVALVQKGPAGRYVALSSSGWMINHASKQKEMGWHFIQWAASGQTQLKAALAGNHAAVTSIAAYQDPQFVKKYDFGGAYVKNCADSLEAGYPDYRPKVEEFSQIGDRMSIALNEALSGQKPVAQALKEAQADALALMKEHKKI